MEKKYIKVFIIGIFLVLAVGTIGFVSAMSNYEKGTYDKITNPFAKVSYAITKGFLFFTSWGQQNQCSTSPDWEGWIRGSATWSNLPSSISCSKVDANKCAIDIWYDNTIYLSKSGGPPSSVNWNNWLKEVTGTGASFSSSSKPYYYAQVYSCPDTITPQVDDHSTDVYVCENGKWSSKGDYEKDQSCSYDASGTGKCWCSDETDNFYVDQSGNVHCQTSSYSNVDNGVWCSVPSVCSDGQTKCEGQDYFVCSDNGWRASGKVNGKCGYTGDTEGPLTAKGDIRLNGAVEIITPALLDFSGYIDTIKVPLKNFGEKTETINIEAGFYSSEYACNTAKLFSCPGTLGSVFPFFSSVPIPNVNPAEKFVNTRQVTLAPGEVEVVELKVNHLDAFVTYPVGTTNVKTKPLVWFAGLYKVPVGGYTNEAGTTGKGVMFDYAQYIPNSLLGGCDNIIGPAKTDIFCGETQIGSCNGDSLTLTQTCTITPTIEVVGGTTATATATTFSGAKKISLTKDVISKSTSADLLASSCLSSSECILPAGDDETFSASCISIAKLRDGGTLTEADSKEFFDNAKKITQGTTIGAAAGITSCIIAGATIGASTGGLALPVTVPLVVGCGIAGGLLGGTGTSIVLDIGKDDGLLKELNANNANAVGICTKESKSGLDDYFKWAAWFDVTGDGNKDGTDGIIIFGVMALLFVLIIGRK